MSQPSAEPAPEPVTVPPLPSPLHWRGSPDGWEAAAGRLTIEAGPGTDLFVDPRGEYDVDTAPCLLAPSEDGWALSARVSLDSRSMYDAGVFVVTAGDRAWAKLCWEVSPDRRPTVVTVVTRGVSDDANGVSPDVDAVWLRASRLGPAWAFHASVDGASWQLVRYFSLGVDPATARVGFSAQSPTGDGCVAVFDHLAWRRAPADIRGGD